MTVRNTRNNSEHKRDRYVQNDNANYCGAQIKRRKAEPDEPLRAIIDGSGVGGFLLSQE